jgi:GTPase Era involved in 16S rRNA processing
MIASVTVADVLPATGSGLARRLTALDRALKLCQGRLDPAILEPAQAVANRAGERLRLSGEHTVVALAGATGSGKSSLFNAIAGIKLSRTGVRRPTTGHALACVWGPQGAQPLLDWLGIPRRHQLGRESVLDAGSQRDLDGLILLDMPDHDSTKVEHRVEVDRLVSLVDLLVWVFDPEKYADAAVHEGYLRPLAAHAPVTLCVFNQADRLEPAAVEQCLADLRVLLVKDGLTDVQIITTSAVTGRGIAELREALVVRVREKRAAGDRLLADVAKAAGELAEHCGDERTGDVDKAAQVALSSALGSAAGIPAVVDAVTAAHRYRGALATGWPLTRWLRRLRPDPLRRLHLGALARGGKSAASASASTGVPPVGSDRADAGMVAAAPMSPRTSLPAPNAITRSQAQSGLRAVGDAAARGLPTAWADAVRKAARSGEPVLADELDRAVAATDLGMDRRPRWWSAVGTLQWLFAAVFVVGLIWLGVLLGFSILRVPEPPTPEVADWPVPTLLVFAGAAAGLVLSVLVKPLIGTGARRRRRRAQARLNAGIRDVAERLVIAPVSAELERYREACAQIQVAAGR